MNIDLIEKVEQIVKQQAYHKNNILGENIWDYHIKIVKKYAIIIAQHYEADEEVVVLASLLHDYASILNKDYIIEHHKYGAIEAEKILRKENYATDKIELVKKCIYSHRSSINIKRCTKEEICISSADAMAHIDQLPSLFFLCFMQKKMSIEESRSWILEKIQKDMDKICHYGKKIIESKYEAALTILEYKSECVK